MDTSEPTDDKYTWRTTPTDRGTGCTCPRCGGKVVINYEQAVAKAQSRGLRSMICMYCERLGLLPPKRKAVKRRRRKAAA